MRIALGWHELLLWIGHEGWWVVCSKENVQHYEKESIGEFESRSEFRVNQTETV